MDNFFSSKMKQKSDNELLAIIEQKNDYDKNALYAALKELQKREVNISHYATENFINELESQVFEEDEKSKTKSELISKNTIYIFSILLTPILIGPFMAFNIWHKGNRKGVLPTILFTILYALLALAIFNYLVNTDALPFILFTYNAAATILLIELLWKKYISEHQK